MPTACTPVRCANSASIGPARRGKPISGIAREALPQKAHQRGVRLDHPAAELRRRQQPGPTVEQHQRLGAGLGLGDEVVGRRLHQHADQPAEERRVGIGHAAGRGEVARAAPLHHVAGDGEGRAGEADQRRARRVGIERRPHPPHRLHDGCRSLGHARHTEGVERRGVAHRRHHRPGVDLQRQRPMAQGTMRDVREQDRPVHPVAADRLQRHLGRQLRRGAEGNEIAGPRPHLAVFGQVAPGLAHEPHRRRPDLLSGQGAQQGLRRPAVPGGLVRHQRRLSPFHSKSSKKDSEVNWACG